MQKYDYLIVGAGLSGAVCAERLATQRNKKVIIIDKRDHIAGNCYDYQGDHGITIQKYGPHIFHTDLVEVWEYLSGFTKWIDYEHRVMARIGKDHFPMPVSIETVNKFYRTNLDESNIQDFYDKIREKDIEIKNSEHAIIAKVGRRMYEKFFKNYTKKHWGVYPSELDRSVCERLPVRNNFDTRYFSDKYQGIPTEGFTEMVKKILGNENITIELATSFHEIKDKIKYGGTIYTGNIDEYFDHRYGNLPYRSLSFVHKTLKGEFQPCAVVNYTSSLRPKFTRITEFKHFNKFKSPYTVIAKEYAGESGDPYYPIPNEGNFLLYAKYKALADKEKNFHCLGRLAEYKYLNIDQVCHNAIKLSESI
jgi:UDP-galactopyranose mutase